MYFNRPTKYTAGTVCKGLLMVMLLSVYTNIVNWLQQHMLPCPFKTLFHFDCPGCGLQRSIIALLRGNVLQSIQIYPALLPMLALFLYAAYHLKTKNKNGLAGIKILFGISASVIFIHYIYKTINHFN